MRDKSGRQLYSLAEFYRVYCLKQPDKSLRYATSFFWNDSLGIKYYKRWENFETAIEQFF